MELKLCHCRGASHSTTIRERLRATHDKSHLEKVGLENKANGWPRDLHKRKLASND